MTSPRIYQALALASGLVLLTSCGNNSGVALASNTKAHETEAQNLYNRATTAEAAGQNKKALKAYSKIAEDFPLSSSAAEARYREAVLLQKSGDLIDAFDAYDVFLKKYPASGRYASAIKQQEEIAHQVAQGHIRNNFIGFKTRIDRKKTSDMLAKVRDNAPRSPSASRAQFAIGELWEKDKKTDRAIASYRTLVRDYPNSSEASEGQFRIGRMLADRLADGNPNPANLDRARNAFEDLLLRYPSSKQATETKRQLAKLSSGDIQRSFDLAEFYRKKGQNTSAAFYYGEVVRKSKPGPLRSQAENWIKQFSQ